METARIYHDYLAALQAGDRPGAIAVAWDALFRGVDVRDIYLEVLQPAMYAIGALWESRQISVAQEHLATAITRDVMAQLAGAAAARPDNGRTMVATCIGSELHDLGIRMVADFFTLEGWQVLYLGANMPIADVVTTVGTCKTDLLAISVTLSGHLLQARDLIAAVRASPAGRGLRVLVGGQPFNRAPDVYRTIGADLMASDARAALRLAQLQEAHHANPG